MKIRKVYFFMLMFVFSLIIFGSSFNTKVYAGVNVYFNGVLNGNYDPWGAPCADEPIYTKSRNVTLQFGYNADNMTDVKVSGDTDFSNNSWESLGNPYYSRAYTLTAGDGVKTVYAIYKKQNGGIQWWGNVAGNPYYDTIILDTTPPTANSISAPVYVNKSSSSFDVYVYGVSDNLSGVASTRFKVWTANNGQDDLKSYSGSNLGGGTWKITVPLSNHSNENGTYNIQVYGTDGAGNSGFMKATNTLVDRVEPTGSININNNVTYTTSTNVNLTIQGTDNLTSVTKMAIWDNNTSTGWINYGTAYNNWPLPAGDGTKRVYIKFLDGAGNESNVYFDDIILDATPPTGSIVINGGRMATNNINVTLNITASDATSGVKRVGVSNSSTFPAASTTWINYSSFSGGTYTFIGWSLPNSGVDGNKTIYLKIEDNAGLSSNVSDTIMLDRVAPTGTVLINNGDIYTNSSPLHLSLNATDNLSGVAKMYIVQNRNNSRPINSPTVPADLAGISDSRLVDYVASRGMTYTGPDNVVGAFVWFMDNADNISVVAMDDIEFDAHSPTGRVTINKKADGTQETETNKTTVTLDFTKVLTNPDYAPVKTLIISNYPLSNGLSYDLSKVKVVEPPVATYDNWSLDTTSQGTKTVYAKYIDEAGNWSNLTPDDIIYTGPITFATIDHQQYVRKYIGRSIAGEWTSDSLLTVYDGWNNYQHSDYIVYRVNFEVPNRDYASKMKDVRIRLYLNDNNSDSVDEELSGDVVLKKYDNTSGVYILIKALGLSNTNDVKRISRNTYEVILGKDGTGIPIMEATSNDGFTKYSLEYKVKISIRKNEYDNSERELTIRNNAEFITVLDSSGVAKIIEPEMPANKFYIDTKITRNIYGND